MAYLHYISSCKTVNTNSSFNIGCWADNYYSLTSSSFTNCTTEAVEQNNSPGAWIIHAHCSQCRTTDRPDSSLLYLLPTICFLLCTLNKQFVDSQISTTSISQNKINILWSRKLKRYYYLLSASASYKHCYCTCTTSLSKSPLYCCCSTKQLQ